MTVATQPMIGRRQLRLAVVGALQSAGLSVNGTPVQQESPGDWDIPEEQLAMVTVRTTDETKQAQTSGQANFTTTCSVVVRAVLANETAEKAQDDIEGLWYAVEFAMLTNFSIVNAVQRISSVRSTLEVKADGARQLAGMVGVFELEYFEAFDAMQPPPAPTPWPKDPPTPAPMTDVSLTGDLVNVFDPSGNYPGAPFPAAVQPAPRTSGPDGRTEVGLSISLEGSP